MSGFLLGMEYLKKEMNISVFFNRKLQRLLPLFLLALILGSVFRLLSSHKIPEHFNCESFDLVLFIMYYNTPLWYMVVEFVLLLFSPFFVYLLHKKNFILYATLLMMSFSCFMYSRVGNCASYPDGLYFSPLARCWQFLLGMAVAELCRQLDVFSYIRSRKGSIITTCMFLFFICLSVLFVTLKQNSSLIDYWNYSFSFNFITSVFFAFLIPLLYGCRILFFKSLQSVLTYFALLTYPVYLFHVVVWQYVVVGFDKLFHVQSLKVTLPISVVVTLLLSVCCMYCENHFLRLRFSSSKIK